MAIFFAVFCLFPLSGVAKSDQDDSEWPPKKSASVGAFAKLDRDYDQEFLQRLRLAYKFQFFLFVFLATKEDFKLSRILQCTAQITLK